MCASMCVCVRLDQAVRQCPPTRKKQLKRLKSPKARREAKRDRKPCEFFAGVLFSTAPHLISPFSTSCSLPPSSPAGTENRSQQEEPAWGLGYCDWCWNCPGQLHRNLTSIRTYYLNRGSGPAWHSRWLNAPPLPVPSSLLPSNPPGHSFCRLYDRYQTRSIDRETLPYRCEPDGN